MAYFQKQTLEDYIKSNFSYTFGSLANLYSAFLEKKDISKEELDNLIKEIQEKAIEINYQLYQDTAPFEAFEELEQALLKRHKEKQKKRVIGRYFASELYQIISGKLLPKQYLNPPEPSVEDLRRMYWGEVIDLGLKNLFGQTEEKKYEIKITPDISIICKTDLEFDGGIVEIKTRQDLSSYDYLPVWWLYQCLSYMFAKKLKEMRLFMFGWGFSRKLFKVKFDNKVWQEVVEKLKQYHQRVKQAYEPKNNKKQN